MGDLTRNGCIDMTNEAREFKILTNQSLNFNNEPANPGIISTNGIFVLFGLPIFTGAIGNIVILSVVACSQLVRSRPFLFLISIASSDLFLVLFCGPAELNHYFGFLIRTPKSADFFCKGTYQIFRLCLF